MLSSSDSDRFHLLARCVANRKTTFSIRCRMEIQWKGGEVRSHLFFFVFVFLNNKSASQVRNSTPAMCSNSKSGNLLLTGMLLNVSQVDDDKLWESRCKKDVVKCEKRSHVKKFHEKSRNFMNHVGTNVVKIGEQTGWMDGGSTLLPTVKSKLPRTSTSHEVHPQSSGNWQKLLH